MTDKADNEMRISADDFDRIMRGALQAKPPAKGAKLAPVKKARRISVKRRRK